jgi:hypothetical protein
MADTWYLWLIPMLPLAGAALCGALHFATLAARKRDPEAAGPSGLAPFVACGAIGAALVIAVQAFLAVRGLEPEARRIVSAAWPWIYGEKLQIDVALVVDQLSAVMLLVVTGVGFLIHVYSTGYMKGDPGYAKFFAYLNLFVFAMLMLVASSNLLGLFIGWEGVGLCSYLLIGFWYEKGWPAEAGQKAFVMNRIGDACFLVGSFLLVRMFGTLDLSDVGAMVPGVLGGSGQHDLELALAALLLFGGCCGKSAQFPLFTWLPDAMAGPTPVSALIHAATMVTAGVYLVVRLNPLFAASPRCAGRDRRRRSAHGAHRRVHGARAARHQEGPRLLDRQPARLHVPGAWIGRLRGRDLPPRHARPSSRASCSLERAGVDPRHARRAGHATHGRPAQAHAAHVRDVPRRRGRALRPAADERLLLEGRDPRAHFRRRRPLPRAVDRRPGRRCADRVLHLAHGGADLLRPERFDHHHVHPHESPPVMTLPLVILAVLAVLGGALGLPAVSGLPNLIGEWLEPITAPRPRR